MKFYMIFLLIVGFVCSMQTDAAATSSRALRDRKISYTSDDAAYLKETLNRLLDQKAYDEAYALCFKAEQTVPVKLKGFVHLTLGKLCLKRTENGMPCNPQWAKAWFEKVINSYGAYATDKAAAREFLSSIAGEEQNTDYVSHISRRQLKRSCRTFAAVEPQAKARDVAQHTCPQCSKSFDSLRGLRGHQTQKGHQATYNADVELDSMLLFQESQPVVPSFENDDLSDFDSEDFGFLELTEAELDTTCFECGKVCETKQGLRGHEWHKHQAPKHLKEKQDAKRLKESKPVTSQFCPECGDTFKSPQALGSHRKYKH